MGLPASQTPTKRFFRPPGSNFARDHQPSGAQGNLFMSACFRRTIQSALSRFRVQDSGFRVQGSGFQGSGFKVQGSRFRMKVVLDAKRHFHPNLDESVPMGTTRRLLLDSCLSITSHLFAHPMESIIMTVRGSNSCHWTGVDFSNKP